MNRKTIVLAAFALCLAVSLLSGCPAEAAPGKGRATQQSREQSEEAESETRPVAVQGAVVQEGTLKETYSLPVTLQAARRAQVTAQASGAFKECTVAVGQKVKKGQLLGRLDGPAARAALAGAGSSVTAAEQNLQTARQELDRSQRLVDAGYMAPASLDKSKNALEGAQSQLSSARAQAASARAQADLYELRAPFDGTVTSVPAPALGSQVAPGTPMFTVSDLTGMEVKTAVPYVDRGKIADGAPVTLTLEGAERQLTGKVVERGMTVNEANRTFDVTISVDPDPEAIPGAFGTAQVQVKAASGMVVPATALISEGNAYWVWTVGEGYKAIKQPVQVLMTVGNQTVISGVNAGVTVVARGGEKLTGGEVLEVYKDAQ